MDSPGAGQEIEVVDRGPRLSRARGDARRGAASHRCLQLLVTLEYLRNLPARVMDRRAGTTCHPRTVRPPTRHTPVRWIDPRRAQPRPMSAPRARSSSSSCASSTGVAGSRARVAGSAGRPTTAACCWRRPASTRSCVRPGRVLHGGPERRARRPDARPRRSPPERVQHDLLPDPSIARTRGASSIRMGCPRSSRPTSRGTRASTISRSADLEMLKGIPGVDEPRRASRAGDPQHATGARARRPARGRLRRSALRPGPGGPRPRPRRLHLGRRRDGREAPHGGLPLPVRSDGRAARPAARRYDGERARGADADQHVCPTCQQVVARAKIDVVDVAAAVAADRLTEADVFKRTYLGHGTQSSVFVFQGHAGPFRSHVHRTHDEIGYVLEGTGSVTVGGVTRPVKKGDVWVIPANTPHGGEFEDRAAGPVHLVPDRRSRQPGPRLARVDPRASAPPAGRRRSASGRRSLGGG